MRRHLWLFLLAITIVPLTYVINLFVNHSYGRSGGETLIARKDGGLEQVTGDFAWRLFEWSLLQGDKITGSRLFVYEKMGVDADSSKYVAPTDPTPFTVFLRVLLCYVVLCLFRRKN